MQIPLPHSVPVNIFLACFQFCQRNILFNHAFLIHIAPKLHSAYHRVAICKVTGYKLAIFICNPFLINNTGIRIYEAADLVPAVPVSYRRHFYPQDPLL